jgi:hypothetical protein
MSSDGESRQLIVRVRGSRRAKLTPAPGSAQEPVPADEDTSDAGTGPNDDRMRQEKPPHY